MLFKLHQDIKEHEVTDRALYLDRRRFLAMGGAALAMGFSDKAQAAPFNGIVKTPYGGDETPTARDAITSYNNFYELGFGKEDPAHYAKTFPPLRPWTIAVDGECAKPGQIGIDELIHPSKLEERIYRMRCVEAWSMVIPWVGIPAAELLKRFEPTSRAKYVSFTSILAPDKLIGQQSGQFPWPYVEGLRLDEAMHPLTLMAVGLYGDELLPQNGAPFRLVTPWKYGFKSGKSITRISFTETMPRNTWNILAPTEYGFYANVNPEVDHPRWSQSSERRIGEFRRRPTLPFNGYGDQVAGLYSGMDLRKNF